ncbi:MAG: DNA-directed RNA polymerase subunit alpha C-terminal domain-containing protein [Planctomycetota bacterium]
MEAAEAAQTSPRDWSAPLPTDWTGWQAFIGTVNASRVARESLRAHLAQHTDEPVDHRLLGLGLFAAGQREAALEHLQACDDDLCRVLAGEALVSAGRSAEALQTWSLVQDGSPLSVRAHLGRLRVLLVNRDVDGLEAEVAALRNTNASPADLAYAEGVLAEASGDHTGALASWRVAMQHDDSHDEARLRLAFRLDLDGEDDEALSLYRMNLDSGRPVHVGELMNLGALYEDREEYDAAARCFRAVLKDDPTNARARRYLADAEASRRQYYDESRERKADMHNAVLRIPVTDFELSVRARNCLQRMAIHTLGDLITRTESELLSFKNFGETSLQEVKDILAMKGLRLGMISSTRGGDEDDEDEGEVVASILSPTAVTARAAGDAPASDDIRSKPIADLDLSVRSRAALTTLGIATVGNLTETTEETLLSCKNFGQTSLVEIRSKLRELGLTLAS